LLVGSPADVYCAWIGATSSMARNAFSVRGWTQAAPSGAWCIQIAVRENFVEGEIVEYLK
jgi:hypothetical protein